MKLKIYQNEFGDGKRLKCNFVTRESENSFGWSSSRSPLLLLKYSSLQFQRTKEVKSKLVYDKWRSLLLLFTSFQYVIEISFIEINVFSLACRFRKRIYYFRPKFCAQKKRTCDLCVCMNCEGYRQLSNLTVIWLLFNIYYCGGNFSCGNLWVKIWKVTLAFAVSDFGSFFHNNFTIKL